jgi:hypothetical protein
MVNEAVMAEALHSVQKFSAQMFNFCSTAMSGQGNLTEEVVKRVGYSDVPKSRKR